MANTMTLIASSTVGSGGAASIDFTSIPSTYTDLVLKISVRAAGSPGSGYAVMGYRFNGSTTSYSSKMLEGTGSSTASDSLATASIGGGTWARMTAWGINTASSTSNTFSSMDWYIPNYAGSNNKSSSLDWVSENNATTAYAELTASLWSSTSAINQITITADTNFAQYSTAYIYGIKNS